VCVCVCVISVRCMLCVYILVLYESELT
jgi:hypothetical protein